MVKASQSVATDEPNSTDAAKVQDRDSNLSHDNEILKGNDMPNGIKQSGLTPCAKCGLGVMHDNQMMAYKFTVTPMVANLPAIQRQHGMEMMMGAAAPLASVMGPDEDMLTQVGTGNSGLLCLECAIGTPVLELLED